MTNKGGRPMTTREMVTSLMSECLEDAAGALVRTVASFLDPASALNATATLAVALFTARWERGSTKLLSAIHRHPFRDDGRGDCAECGEGITAHTEGVER